MKANMNNNNTNTNNNNNNNDNDNNNNILNQEDVTKALMPKPTNNVFKGANVMSTNIVTQEPLFGSRLQFDMGPPELFQASKSFSGHSNTNNNYYDDINKNNALLGSGSELFLQKTKSIDPIIPLNLQPIVSPKKINYVEDNNDAKQIVDEPIIFIESKIPKSSKLNDDLSFHVPSIYNIYSSCTIKNDLNAVFQSICELLNTYSNEIEYEIDKERKIIEGTVYIRHRSITWIVTIWQENVNSSIVSKVEFQKLSGDCIGFQNFWNDMLNKIDDKFGSMNVNDVQRCDNFEDLFMPDFDFCKPMELDNEQLNNLQEQLHDDFHDIALDALALLCTRLENEFELRTLVSKHERLMQTLTKTVLNHVDSNYIRGALAALQLIINARESFIEQLISHYQILNTIIHLLQHNKSLIRKHAIRLLALLSQKEWQLTNKQCSQIKEQLQKLQTEWKIGKNTEKEFVSWKMFDEIEKRVYISSQKIIASY